MAEVYLLVGKLDSRKSASALLDASADLRNAKPVPMDEYTAKRIAHVASLKSTFDAERLGFGGPSVRAKQPS